MKFPTINSKRARLGAVTLAAVAALAGTSQASHWGQEGAGETRSGFQPTDPSQLPLPFRRHASDDDLPTLGSPIITAGATLADQRVAFTQLDVFTDGEIATVELHRFSDANLIASATVSDLPVTDDDSWGTQGLVGPVVASDHNSPGMIYAVHNDDDAGQPTANTAGNDISLAQIDPVDGTIVRDSPVGGGSIPTLGATEDMTIEATPAISGVVPGTTGTRLIAALVRSGDSSAKHILLISVPDAASPGAHTPTFSLSPSIPDANVFASPSFVEMRDRSGGRVPMIAVPTTDGVKTWRYNNLGAEGAGPSISGLGLTQSISTPVRVDGSSPPSIHCPPLVYRCSAPIYVASQTASEGTVVRKLKQDESNTNPNAPGLLNLIPFDDRSTSPELPGKPARQLAVEQAIPTTGAAEGILQPGRVVVATSKNVFSLDTQNLANADFARVFPNDREIGFEKSAPALSGGLGFISDNAGKQYAFFTDPTKRDEHGSLSVPREEEGFRPAPDALNSTSSINQPAVSRGRVVFGADNGFFLYGPNVAITKPVANGTVSGNTVPLEAYAFNPNMVSVSFYVDNTLVGTDALDDDQTFSYTWDSKASGLLDGPHTIRADATDGTDAPEGQESSANRTFILNNWLNPTAALTVTPNPANPGQDVTLDASASFPTPTEPNETLVRWAFEFDGDNDYDDAIELAGSGGDGIITHRFEPGKHVIGVRVTDSHGDVDALDDELILRVNAPPAANLAIGPNPAAEGQEVSVDASGSTDVDGSITRYEFDLDGNGTFEHDNGANPKVQRVFAPGTTRVSARVTDNEGAPSTVSGDLVVNAKPANQIPTATFKVTPNPVNPDTRVLFDATGAVDPDGTVVRYEWDLDGNGTFETDSQNNPRVQRSYATAKVYNVKLRVTDNLGAVSIEFTGTLTVRSVGRKLPRLTAKVTPMRDAAQPYDFRTTGTLRRPSGITKKAGCTGRVTVTVKAGKRTISRRTTKLRSNCKYGTSVRFRDRERFGSATRLRFTARFQGNKVLRARQATSIRVRVG